MLKVIGAGFGRTGTFTLKTALEALGFGPCYHMVEVGRHPGHDDLWKRAGRGEAIDWDRLFEGYRAAVDWPASAFYDRLADHYPEAKVILTVRDPEAWYESACTTIARGHFEPDHDLATSDRMPDQVIWRGIFGGRFADRTHALAVYHRHIEAVRRRVPPSRLLEYDVRQGWAPLCAFLGVTPPPGVPYPHLNTAAEWQARQRQTAIAAGDAPGTAG
jgi:hypothetical protein